MPGWVLLGSYHDLLGHQVWTDSSQPFSLFYHKCACLSICFFLVCYICQIYFLFVCDHDVSDRFLNVLKEGLDFM